MVLNMVKTYVETGRSRFVKVVFIYWSTVVLETGVY